MQFGDRLPPLNDADKCDANRVHGCESQMWLVGALQDGHWQFAASSDARMIRGLVALLLLRVNGLTAKVEQVDLPDGFSQWGCDQLSPRAAMVNAVLHG